MARINPAAMSNQEVMNGLLDWLKRHNPEAADFWIGVMIADVLRELNAVAWPGRYFTRLSNGNYGFRDLPHSRQERRSM